MNLKFKRAIEEEELLKDIIEKLGWNYINSEQIRCVFSENSSSRAVGRIWSTPRIFGFAFGSKPCYVVELIKNKYEKLSNKDKVKVLIHELMHIPKTFSGALSPHNKMGKTLVCNRLDTMYNKYYQLLNQEEKEKLFGNENIITRIMNRF